MNIVVQLIGGLGIIANVISFQCKSHNRILLFKTLNELIFAVQYFLLGAYTGAAVNIIGVVRNVVFTKQIENNKKTTITAIIFSVLFCIFGLFFWQGSRSILIIVAKVLSTLAYGNKNTAIMRGIILTTSVSWLIYNYRVCSVAGFLCEALTLISLIIGIIRLDIIPLLSVKARLK